MNAPGRRRRPRALTPAASGDRGDRARGSGRRRRRRSRAGGRSHAPGGCRRRPADMRARTIAVRLGQHMGAEAVPHNPARAPIPRCRCRRARPVCLARVLGCGHHPAVELHFSEGLKGTGDWARRWPCASRCASGEPRKAPTRCAKASSPTGWMLRFAPQAGRDDVGRLPAPSRGCRRSAAGPGRRASNPGRRVRVKG